MAVGNRKPYFKKDAVPSKFAWNSDLRPELYKSRLEQGIECAVSEMPNCCVYKCRNRTGHLFPKDEALRKKWEAAIKRKQSSSLKTRSIVCSDHFKEEDYRTECLETGEPLQKRRLIKDAVPSVFSWNGNDNSEIMKTEDAELTGTADMAKSSKCGSSSPVPPSLLSYQSVFSEVSDISDVKCEIDCEVIIETSENSTLDFSLKDEQEVSVRQKCHSGIDSQNAVIKGTAVVDTKTVATQTTFRNGFSIMKIKGKASYLAYYTGFKSYKEFTFVFNMLKPGRIGWRGSPVLSLGSENQFLLTIMKLRRASPDFELAIMFELSEETVKNIFFTWIRFMASEWAELDIGPASDLVKDLKNAPCTGVKDGGVARSLNLTTEQNRRKSDEDQNTQKLLMGTTLHVSPAFAGPTSYHALAVNSSSAQNDKNVSSVRDCGFTVQDLCATKNVAQNVPAFLKGKTQLPGLTVLKVRKLDSKHVHVERVMEFSKKYRILKQEMSGDLLNIASEIVFVCGVLCNFQECAVVKKDCK